MKLNKTIVIAALFCCGKTYLANHTEYEVLDVEEEIKYQNHQNSMAFVKAYVNKIQQALGSKDIIFIAPRQGVMASLRKLNIPYVLVYPEKTKECMDEWEKRAKERGDKDHLWKKVKYIFGLHLASLKNDKIAKSKIELKPNQYLSDVIEDIIATQKK